MKNLVKIIGFAFLIAGTQIKVVAQPSYELSELAQKKMAELAFLEGTWRGSGWMMNQDQKRLSFEQEEIVQMKLSGTAVLIEGTGKSEGRIVHHALAILSPEEAEGKFVFTSFLQSGTKGTFPAEMVDGKLYWYPSGQVRYIIELNEQGQWFEVGEYNAGSQWYKFFEMTLDKVN